MQVRAEQLGDEIYVLEGGDEDVAQGDDLEFRLALCDRNLVSSGRTFSWRRCFRSFNSRYVLFDRTGVLKGFMIFLMATDWAVNSSLAELEEETSAGEIPKKKKNLDRQRLTSDTHQTRPKAPMPTG